MYIYVCVCVYVYVYIPKITYESIPNTSKFSYRASPATIFTHGEIGFAKIAQTLLLEYNSVQSTVQSTVQAT